MGKTKTRTALWKLITKKELTPKELYKIDELIQNIKAAVVTILVIIAIVMLINTSGCLDERLG